MITGARSGLAGRRRPDGGARAAAAKGRRRRVESPPGALALIVALAAGEQAFWAVALFVGLRRGELRALRWSDVVLAAGAVITVTRTWENDAVSGVGFRVDFALADACG